MSDIIRELEKEQLRNDLPELEIGDTVRVFVKVVEGNRERLQQILYRPSYVLRNRR